MKNENENNYGIKDKNSATKDKSNVSKEAAEEINKNYGDNSQQNVGEEDEDLSTGQNITDFDEDSEE